MNYVVLRTFFNLGTKYYVGETITISDSNYANNLIQWGAIGPVPVSTKVLKVGPPVSF